MTAEQRKILKERIETAIVLFGFSISDSEVIDVLNKIAAEGKRAAEEEGMTRVCKECGRELPISEFPYRKDGLYRLRVCRDCRVDRGDKTAYICEMQRRRRKRLKQGFKPNPEMLVEYVDKAVKRVKLPPKNKPKPEKGCIKCWLYPCFEGIENFDTDFSKTCLNYNEKSNEND